MISSTISLLSWQLLFFRSSLSTLGTNFAQILRIFSSSLIIVCTVPTLISNCALIVLYRHTTVLIHEILYLANQLWYSDFLTLPTPLIIPHRLPAFLESLMPLRNWCSIHAYTPKAVWCIPYVYVALFPSLKHNFIAYRSSKVCSRPDCIFEIHQLWQSVRCIPISAVAVHLNLKS